MLPTAFLITITTTDAIKPETYNEVATRVVEALHKITGTKLAEFTKPHLTDPWCDVKVSLDEFHTVLVAVVLLAWAPKAWSLDKNKLTALLRDELPFTVKLTKRSVDKNELERILETHHSE